MWRPTPPASNPAGRDCPERARLPGESKGKRHLARMWCPERSTKHEVEGLLLCDVMFFCCILECADGFYYAGVSDDPQRRVQEHNDGKGSDWTAQRRPVKLVWTEAHPALSSARQRENQLKRWGGGKKAKLIGGSPRSATADSGQVAARKA